MGLSFIIALTATYASVIAQNISFDDIILSPCLNDREFLIFADDDVNFDVAQLFCQQEDASLASIPDEDTNQFIASLILSVPEIRDFDFWFGLFRDGSSNPFLSRIESTVNDANERILQTPEEFVTEFNFIDGSVLDPNFATVRGVEPWDFDEPDNNGGDENCVSLSVEINDSGEVIAVWKDRSCNLNQHFICSRECSQIVERTSSPTTLSSIVTNCLNDEIELVVSTVNVMTFNQATQFCLNEDSSLISISNGEIFSFVRNEMIDFGIFDLLWTGLMRERIDNDLDGIFDEPLADEFMFTDGTQSDDEFGLINGILPWSDEKPSLFGDFTTCVFLDPNLDFRYTDFRCEPLDEDVLRGRALCERPCSNDQESLEEVKMQGISFDQKVILGGISVMMISVVMVGLFMKKKMMKIKVIENQQFTIGSIF